MKQLLVALVLLAALAAFGGATGSLGDDIWWHLRLGQTIVQTGDLAPEDSFSYTFAGQPQRNSEWLADVVIHAAYSLAGEQGLIGLRMVLYFITLLLLLLAVQRRPADWTEFAVAVITLILVTLALRFRLSQVRPFLFSYMFFALAFVLALRGQALKPGLSMGAWFALTLVWSNTSNAAIFAPVLAVLLGLGVPATWRKNLVVIAATGVGCALLTLANPDGLDILTRLFSFNAGQDAELGKSVSEHQPLFTQLLSANRLTYAPGLVLVLLSLVAAIVWRKTLSPGHGVLIALFVAGALAYSRLIEFAILVSAPALAMGLRALIAWARQGHWFPHRLFASASILALPVATFVADPSLRTMSFGAQELAIYPVQAIQFVRQHKLPGRMYNNYNASSYLIWNLPEYPVFIDARAGVLYNGAFFSTYKAMNTDPAVWARETARWGINFALFYWDVREQESDQIPLHLAGNPDWALVLWDNRSAIYVRRSQVSQQLLDYYAYRLVNPALTHYDAMKLRGRTDREGLLRDLDHDVGLSTHNQETRIAKAFFLIDDLSPAALQEKIRLLSACTRLYPDLAFEHAMYAKALLETGRRELAAREVGKALELNSTNPLANTIASRLRSPSSGIGQRK